MMKKVSTYLIYFSLLFIACQSESTPSDQSKVAEGTTLPEMVELNKMLNEYPTEGDLWFQRGSLYFEMDKFPEAIRDLKKAVELDSSDIEAYHLLADAYLDNLQSREALQIMESIGNRFPQRIPSLLKLSEFQLILKRYGEAMNTLDRIQEIDPLSAHAFFMRGMVLKENGDTARAIREFQEATRENPQMTDAWINLGQLHEARSDPDALRYFDAGLSISPENLLLLHAKAQYLARSNQPELAKAVYRKMLEISPYEEEPYYDLGLLYLDQDSLTQASTHFDLAIKIDPMFGRAYFYRGLTRELMGDQHAARRDYEQALQINSEDTDAVKALDRVRENI
ncbi:MAG: tetratricopeptide repeat protein [Saprospiraceae bacterium]|nr:tetratricopeptide repeat protein [Saprospiraceae bacterium]